MDMPTKSVVEFYVACAIAVVVVLGGISVLIMFWTMVIGKLF